MRDDRSLSSDMDLIARARAQAQAARVTAALPYRATLAVERTQHDSSRRLASGHAPTIPGYDELREHHRGGQGVVYSARQIATGRRVALKLLYSTDPAPESQQRFFREVQALARLRHPNIVTIHDSGIVESRCFLAMDYIDGLPLDRWIRQQETGRSVARAETTSRARRTRRSSRSSAWEIEDTLDIFVQICDAVQAAHVRGIIHRDLKPANILVDATGSPHVLDFGLVKIRNDTSLGARLQPMTMAGQFLGSVPWSSPEQVDGREDIDTRSDVYSLGVLLYQCLTNDFPYPVDQPLPMVFEHIRRRQPIPPSQRREAINDELETIVLRCLAKEPDRRYQTAGEVGRDIERFLNGLPIEAKRDSFTYLTRKTIARYRWHIAALSTFLVMLAAGLGVSLYLWRAAVVERDRARVAKAEAEQRRMEAELVGDLLQEMLRSTDPAEQHGQTPTVAGLLDEFDRIAPSRFAGQPAVEAETRLTVGTAYARIGSFEKAQRQLDAALAAARTAFGAKHKNTYGVQLARGSLAAELGHNEEAESIYHEILAGSEEVAPTVTPQALNLYGRLLTDAGRLDEAGEMLERANHLASERLDRLAPNRISAIHTLGDHYCDLGRYEDAVRQYELSAELYCESRGDSDVQYGISLHDWGVTLTRLGRLREARQKLDQALLITETAFGKDHLRTLGPRQSIAVIDIKERRSAAAEDALEKILALQRSALPPKSQALSATLFNLSSLYLEQGRHTEAEQCLQEALAIARHVFPAGHPQVADSCNNLAQLYYAQGQYTRAEKFIREALEMNRRLLPSNHPQVIDCFKGLGHILTAQTRFEEASMAVREATARNRARLPASSPVIRANELQLADLLLNIAGQAADCEDAAEMLRSVEEAISIRQAYLPENDWRIGSAVMVQADAFRRAGRAAEAIDALLWGWGLLSDDPTTPAPRRARGEEQWLSQYPSVAPHGARASTP